MNTVMYTLAARFLTRIRNRHFLLIDVIVLCITPIAAYLLRTDAILRGPALPLYILYTLCLRLLVFWWAGFYARYWRRASIDELGTLLAGNVLAMLLVIAVFMTLRLPATGVCTQLPAVCELPRSLPLIDSLLVLAAVTGLRLGARLAEVWNHRHVACSTAPQRVLVAGAGDAGTLIVDELHANPQLGMQPIGFVDDDPEKRGIQIHGVPVLGAVTQLAAILADYRVQHVIIAMPSAPGKVVRALRDTCEAAGVKTRTIPGLCTLLDGTVTVSQLRKVEIEDLLRRDPVGVDTLSLREILADKRVLVTGGGGSIGRELCRQLLYCRPAELVVLGHGENSVFEIVQELQYCLPSGGEQTRIRACIADVRCAGRMLAVFQELHPQIVFHAAAHKHVPLMEEHPAEAVTNNILGTRNVVAAAQAVGVERFVMISTDKAVRPTSVMGASKRVAELIVRRAALQSGRPYVAVRFGNVLGSRGSVVLTFKQQIAARRPGYRHRPPNAALLYDHPRGRAACPAGRGAGGGRRGLYAGDGRARQDRRPGTRPDSSLRAAGGARH